MYGNWANLGNGEELLRITEELKRDIDGLGLGTILKDPVNTVGMYWDDLKLFLLRLGYLNSGKLVTRTYQSDTT
jgi:hypothetical protein